MYRYGSYAVTCPIGHPNMQSGATSLGVRSHQSPLIRSPRQYIRLHHRDRTMPFFRANGLTSPLFQQLNTSVAASASAADGKVMGQGPFGTKYYLQGALAGGICCSITHGALTPVDVVKTRIQLDPVKYNQGFIGGFKQVIADEGAGALLTGLGPTAQGYFIQVSGVLRSNAARAGAWVGGGAPSGARGVLRRGGGAALASPKPDVA